jgi:photosystem II stability/assembly factor-like uncharacterized protein
LAAAVGAAALAAGWVYAATQDDDSASSGAAPYVGGDLHTITAVDDRLYVGGHDGVAVSTDGGQAWTPVPSLGGADAMGWAQTTAGLLVGGHPGLYRSTDGAATFTKATGEAQVGDVHAVGAAGDIAYLASPQAGLLASSDGGASWEPRNTGVGQGFMGTILVDPADPQRIIAPDMANGLVTSSDGGRTWSVLGGPGGAMSAGWDPTDTGRLVAVGMSGAALSSDGGRTWTDLQMPEGTSAATFSTDGSTLYAAALDGDTARIYASTDDGRTWTTP